jgi:hypothetical protein
VASLEVRGAAERFFTQNEPGSPGAKPVVDDLWPAACVLDNVPRLDCEECKDWGVTA